jgi:hypothetical protein
MRAAIGAIALDLQLSTHAIPLELERPPTPLIATRNPGTQQHWREETGQGLAVEGRPWHQAPSV